MSADSDFEAQREMNRRVVKAQRVVLGVDKPEEKWVFAGFAKKLLHIPRYRCHACVDETLAQAASDVEGCGHQMSDEQLAECVELAKKQIRCDAQGQGYLVSQVTTHKLLNGDVEVRGELKKKVSVS